MVSVVVPAHNEEAVIGRCLKTLLEEAPLGELEVYVVANGCSDRTAQIALEFPGVTVIETAAASKAAALNDGDAAAVTFPRFFLDADVELHYSALQKTAESMWKSGALIAAPGLTWDREGRSFGVRAYYRVWAELPYGSGNLVGNGVFALSEDARKRFDRFPPIIADDLFIRNIYAPEERLSVKEASFLIHPPRTVRDLVRVLRRQQVGNAELKLLAEEGRRAWQTSDAGQVAGGLARLKAISSRPAIWPLLPVHLTIYLTARIGARLKYWRGDMKWDRDDSSRVSGGDL
jgi:glycosyltransferase involved in cell wall biosynthesis